MSLLTDKELKLYHCKAHDEWYSQNCSNCMIDSNEPDIIAKTLRAVGEWVLDNYESGDGCQCIMFVNNLVNALREGKMP